MSLMSDLREVNAARDAEWDTSDKGLDGSFFGNELAGEVGEAIEVVDHLFHGFGPVGPTVDDLGAELADVVIVADLLALKFGIFVEPDEPTRKPIGPEAESIRLAVFTGRACNITKKLERERLGLVGSRATVEDLAAELKEVLTSVQYLADQWGIRLEWAIPIKFNVTSDKCGLVTKMSFPQ